MGRAGLGRLPLSFQMPVLPTPTQSQHALAGAESWAQTGKPTKGVQARGRGSPAVGPARAGRGYSVTAAPRGHRLPLLPVTKASASARSALGGWPGLLRPLREETAQDQGPRNSIGCARPRQAPPPEPPLPLSPGGVCAAAGSALTRPRCPACGARVQRGFPDRVAAGLSWAAAFPSSASPAPRRWGPPRHSAGQCTGASGIWAREAPPSARHARFPTPPRSSELEGAQ